MITVTNKIDCTGCFGCYNICPQKCISMPQDEEGFWYPTADETSCINCGKCERVCPIINKVNVSNEPKAYACNNKNETIRGSSSSGGIFTLIAEKVISGGGIVFGAGFDRKFNVVHSYINKKEDLGVFRGSKYVQSKTGDTYKNAKDSLIQGQQVLFSGTPCQIGGLKSYLQQDYDNLLCVDIICHGVPSPKVWQKYVSYRENCAGSQSRRIAFRRKNEGWKRYSVSFIFENDTEYMKNLDKDLYVQAFQRNICLRPSCYACNYKTLHRQSDITLGDFWGVENIAPELDDDKGTSLIFVNSTAGNALFESIKNKIFYKQVDINKAVAYNQAAVKSVESNRNREKFFKNVDLLGFDKLIEKHCSDSLILKYQKKLRAVLSKAKRSIMRKLLKGDWVCSKIKPY